MGKHKGQELSYQIQLFQQMRQINEEIVSHLQTSEKNRKKKGKYVTFTPGAKPGPHQLEQQNVKASRVLTHTKWHSAGSIAQIILHRQVCLRHIFGFLLLMGFCALPSCPLGTLIISEITQKITSIQPI